MQITAEQAHLIALRIAGAVDEVTERDNATAVLDIHGQGGTILAVVITANPLLTSELLNWARSREGLGSMVTETHPHGT